jgi:hypothetical protein
MREDRSGLELALVFLLAASRSSRKTGHQVQRAWAASNGSLLTRRFREHGYAPLCEQHLIYGDKAAVIQHPRDAG